MKKLVLTPVLCTVTCLIFGQYIKTADLQLLQTKEDSLKLYASKLMQGVNVEERFKADSLFTKMFVRALLTRNSFYYPFDSLQSISRLYSPDSSFRIFTWQMVINENIVRQHGAIQMKTGDGILKLYPLIDKSDITVNLADTLTNNKGWIGAVYYKIIKTKIGNQPCYTLLGFDENNIRSHKKIIEVLKFANGEPEFGGRFFSFEEDDVARPAVSRYIMEYKKDAGARLTYDEDLDMIVFEHLQSETNEPQKKWTYIPDGDYEGFKWKNGKWLHVDKVFTQVTPEGKEPVPHPVKDVNGNIMEDKLPADTRDDKAPAATKKPATPIKKKKSK